MISSISSSPGKIQKSNFLIELEDCFKYVELEQDRKLGALDREIQVDNIRKELDKQIINNQEKLRELTLQNDSADLFQQNTFATTSDSFATKSFTQSSTIQAEKQSLEHKIKELQQKRNAHIESMDPHDLLFFSFDQLTDSRFGIVYCS